LLNQFFFGKQVQKLLAYRSPAPASADEESGLGGLKSTTICGKINPTDSVIPIDDDCI